MFCYCDVRLVKNKYVFAMTKSHIIIANLFHFYECDL